MSVWEEFQRITMPKSALTEGHARCTMEDISPLIWCKIGQIGEDQYQRLDG